MVLQNGVSALGETREQMLPSKTTSVKYYYLIIPG